MGSEYALRTILYAVKGGCTQDLRPLGANAPELTALGVLGKKNG